VGSGRAFSIAGIDDEITGRADNHNVLAHDGHDAA
jgi:hypothetical protein